jgi:predicted dehydrogenase
MLHQTERRGFLKSSAAAGILLLKPETVFGTQANSAMELGLIGCGARGKFIGGLFLEHTLTRVVALADAFRDPVEETVRSLKLNSPRQYVGLNAFRELAASKLDAVAVISPPYFHPDHVEAAVAAGKHVYLAKPVAVDVPGCLSVAASGDRAKGKLSFLVDWQLRVRPVFQEAAARLHRGEIGTPVLGHVFYHGGRLRARSKPGMPADEARLRNWVFDKVLSGDIIVEQNIHLIDVTNWYAQSHPLKAHGTGGRKARVDVGDCWDHFLVNYWYPNDLKVDFSSTQFTKGFTDKCVRMYGTLGTLDSHLLGVVNITGDRPWKGTGAEKDDTANQGSITNVKSFVESVRTGQYLNNAAPGAESTLTAILGRTAAYGERMVTWDEMMRAGEKLTATLKL